MQPAVHGILESALYVEDLDRSANFYQKIFGFKTVGRSERRCALGVAEGQVFLLFKKGKSARPSVIPGGTIPGHDGTGSLHVAFSIAADSLNAWRDRLEKNGVAIESTVDWDRGGTSLYFRDPDHHVIELATPGTWEIY